MVCKPALNLTHLGPLLIHMKLADPSHQTCRRMQGLVEQRGRMTGATPIHRKQRSRRSIRRQSWYSASAAHQSTAGDLHLLAVF
jgi:hypothetical protein